MTSLLPEGLARQENGFDSKCYKIMTAMGLLGVTAEFPSLEMFL